jgi:CrcB protein
MNVPDIAYVALGGAVGAVSRVLMDVAVRARIATRVPAGTIFINLSGSLLLGLIAGLVLAHTAPEALEVVVGTGFCGGYTTFSTASFETVRLAQEGEWSAAVRNGGGTLAGALAAAAIGLAIGLAT